VTANKLFDCGCYCELWRLSANVPSSHELGFMLMLTSIDKRKIEMLEVSYSLDEAINIKGSWIEIDSLRQIILNFINSDLEIIYVKTGDKRSPTSWNFIAKHLQIVQNDKAVKVSILDENAIQIEGSKENLEKFTSFLSFEEDCESGFHTHYEYYEGNECIISDSFPLIIQIK
jgi:hypothetical protein